MTTKNYISCQQAANAYGGSAGFWRGLFDAGLVSGFVGSRKRFISVESIDSYVQRDRNTDPIAQYRKRSSAWHELTPQKQGQSFPCSEPPTTNATYTTDVPGILNSEDVVNGHLA